jgi:hypothetical protein
MRGSEGGFMWYRNTGHRAGALASSPGSCRGVRWQDASATAACASEKETSRKIALRSRARAACSQRRRVGIVSPEKRTERPGFETR